MDLFYFPMLDGKHEYSIGVNPAEIETIEPSERGDGTELHLASGRVIESEVNFEEVLKEWDATWIIPAPPQAAESKVVVRFEESCNLMTWVMQLLSTTTNVIKNWAHKNGL